MDRSDRLVSNPSSPVYSERILSGAVPFIRERHLNGDYASGQLLNREHRINGTTPKNRNRTPNQVDYSQAVKS